MLIEILGAGCPKCKKTYDTVKNFVERNGINAEIIKVENIETLAGRGIMMTPAIAVDGVVKLSGRVPSEKEVAAILAS
jgi:small redox-active disulfide protein 2